MVLIFDLDGTLTDSKEGITKCVQYTLKHFGIEADCEDLLPFIGPPLIDSFMKGRRKLLSKNIASGFQR